MGMVEIAGAILSQAENRTELAAQNIANMTTAGYKARQSFAGFLDTASGAAPGAQAGTANVDFSGGKLMNTGNPLDLAIQGPGFFAVRSGHALAYTRDGAFVRDGDGHLVTTDGAVLQSGGGDVVVAPGAMSVLPDGTLMQQGQPNDKIALADFADPSVLRPLGAGLFSAPAGAASDVASPRIEQGMLESSNVSLADEMLSIMASLRSAESGQQVVRIYDELLQNAMSAFGQS
jgi:flagellar basal body rod protein FlgG